jgi:hypothetical protein
LVNLEFHFSVCHYCHRDHCHHGHQHCTGHHTPPLPLPSPVTTVTTVATANCHHGHHCHPPVTTWQHRCHLRSHSWLLCNSMARLDVLWSEWFDRSSLLWFDLTTTVATVHVWSGSTPVHVAVVRPQLAAHGHHHCTSVSTPLLLPTLHTFTVTTTQPFEPLDHTHTVCCRWNFVQNQKFNLV